MKSGNEFWQRFIKYVSLNVFSMLGLSLYILADTFFIANGVGSQGLTALNLVLPVYSVISGIGLLLGMGGAILYSIYMGAGQKQKADSVYSTVLVLALVISVVIAISGSLVKNTLVYFLGGRDDVAVLSRIYLKYIFLFTPAFIINSVLVCFVRNDNDPKLAMAAMLCGSISNIVLDYIFIFPFGGGMFGAVIATCMAPLISIGILSRRWVKKQNRFTFKRALISLKPAGKIFYTGVPSFITELSSAIIMLLFNFVIMELSGDIGVAAYGIIANLALIVVAIFNGISQGIQPIVSDGYGRKDDKTVKKSVLAALTVSLIIGSLCYLLGVFEGNRIVAMFNRDNDALLADIAVTGVWIYFSAFVIMGLNMITIAFLATVQRVRASFLLSILRGVILIIPLLFLLSGLFQLTGVWLTIPFVELVTMIFTGIIFIKWLKGLG